MLKNDDKTQYMVVLYTERHLTYRQIAHMVKMSATMVGRYLKAAGVKAKDGEWVKGACDYCGSDITSTRCKWRKTRKHYCGEQCYFKALENPAYIPWRQGQNIARSTVKHYYHLLPHNVVHHKDGDNHNNKVDNLVVYENQADHMSVHRGVLNITPIWEWDA